MMKRALLISAVLVLFAAFTALAADLVVSEDAETSASPAQVWSVLLDIDNWPGFVPILEDSKKTRGDCTKVGDRMYIRPIINGRPTPTKMKMKLEKIEPGKLLEFTSRSAGMDIVFGFRIEVREGKTVVVSYETIREPGARIYRTLYGEESLSVEHKAWAKAMAAEAEKRAGANKG